MKNYHLTELQNIHSTQHEAPSTSHEVTDKEYATAYKLLDGRRQTPNVRGRALILLHLQAHGETTLVDLHKKLELKYELCRRYCLMLEKQGLIEYSDLNHRPQKVRLTETGTQIAQQIAVGADPTEELLEYLNYLTGFKPEQFADANNGQARAFRMLQRLRYLTKKMETYHDRN